MRKNSRWHIILVLLVICLNGCASGRSTVTTKSGGADEMSVRKVDFGQAPELKELAERARRIGNEMYQKVLALLADDTSNIPEQFDIVFKKPRDPNQYVGRTRGATIRFYLDAEWFAKNPAVFDLMLIHEMAHLTQGLHWYRPFNTAWTCWMEGIPDYVRYKLGYTNGWRCPQCSVEFPHYTYGYTCAGAFLLFVDATYGSNVVRQLNTELRRRTYSDKLFATATGKSLNELWVQFQKTSAFTPVAVEVDKLYNALGYVNGKPPRDVRARFMTYLNRQGRMNELHDLAGELNDKSLKDVLLLHAKYQYLEEPAEFLGGLGDKDQLPGFLKDELRGILFRTQIPPGECESWVYPMSRTISCTKNGDPSTFHYLVVQASKDNAWKLQKAWRSGPDGRVIEEYSVP